MFYPHSDYCCEVWGSNTYTTNIQCLYLLQKKSHVEYYTYIVNTSTNELFVGLNILKLKDIFKYKSYSFAFKTFNGKVPSGLNPLFLIKSGLYGMRSTNNCVRTICILGHPMLS